MGYYIIRSNIQNGTRWGKDKSPIYKYVKTTPRPGPLYKIPAPPRPTSGIPVPKDTNFKYVFKRGVDKSAIRVWDRRAYTSTVRPGTRFIPVPESLRCADVRVIKYTVKMFAFWEHPSKLFPNWIGDGCYAAPMATIRSIEAAAHYKLKCLGLSMQGWNTVFGDADCLDVGIIFEPDENFDM